MRVLAFDSGAERAGIAVLETGPLYVFSEVAMFSRGKTDFQKYRLGLAEYWVLKTNELLWDYRPDIVVTETVPSTGANNMSQLYLANVMASTVHAICFERGFTVKQVSARSVQSKIAIRGKSKNITKVQVRNGVIDRLPELEPRKKDWIKIYEEPDAIAIGLYTLNHKIS
jgi:hypothetical protein